MQAIFETKRPQFSAFVLALAVVAALIVGGASGFLLKSMQGSPPVLTKAAAVRPAIDALTGYASGSVDDQRILAFLKQSGYEGGGTVVKAVVLQAARCSTGMQNASGAGRVRELAAQDARSETRSNW